MKQKNIICATLLSLGLVSVTHAATQGMYVGAGLGIDKVYLNQYINHNQTIHSDNDTTAAGRLFVGYNLNDYLGVEAGYTDFGRPEAMVSDNGVTIARKKYHFFSYDVRGKAYLPIMNNKANLYAIGGIASANNQQYRPVYGFGTNLAINDKVTTSAEVTRQEGSYRLPDINALMITAAYNFN